MLDHRKDEAVERTFKGVAKNFRDIFAQVGLKAKDRVKGGGSQGISTSRVLGT